MNPAGGAVALSQLDSERFGVPIARAALVSAGQVDEVLRFCGEHAVALAIVRCATSDLAAVHDLERHGFRMMDTLVYYAADLGKGPLSEDPGQVVVRPLRAGEEDAVRQIAAAAFTGYLGHYHADPRLDRAQCDAAYIEWSVRSCVSREVADIVLLACAPGPLGYCALRRDEEQQFDIRLLAVAPSARRRGVSQALLLAARCWARQQGAERLTISTQLANLASQKAYVRAGFEPLRSYYTLHKWFDDPK